MPLRPNHRYNDAIIHGSLPSLIKITPLNSYPVLEVDIDDSYTYYQVSLDHAVSDVVTTHV